MGGHIVWNLKGQSVATSSIEEAEYVALSNATKVTYCIRRIGNFLGKGTTGLEANDNNQATTNLVAGEKIPN